MRPGGSGMRRRIELAVTDFPQPLSPTTARVSPSRTSNETPSTARLTPSGVRKCVCRFSTSNSAIALETLRKARIERIAHAIAKQIHSEHRQRQECRRKEHDERLHLPKRAAIRHDVP